VNEKTTANQGEQNGSLREFVQQFTDLEELRPRWSQGRCFIPGCDDEDENFIVFPEADGTEVFFCEGCRVGGSRADLERLMFGHQHVPLAFGDHYPLAEAITQGIEPPEELEPGVLLKGKVHSINGGAGEGKTWLALWLIKRRIDRGERVVYFDSENGPRIVAERLALLGADTRRIDELLRYYPFPSLSDEREVVAEYHAQLDAFEPDLVIFDSQANFLGASGLEESSNDDLIKWATNYTRPARAREIAVVILDHTGHNGDHARGASRKRDEADVIWHAKTTAPFDRDTVGRLVLKREKDREAWLPERVGFSVGGTDDGFVFRASDGTIEEPDPESGLTATARRVLEVLRDDFGADGATSGAWRKACAKPPLKVTRPTFYRALDELKRSHEVEWVSQGRETYYYAKDNPDGGGGGEGRETYFSRSNSGETDRSQKVSNWSHETHETNSKTDESHWSHHPFRGETNETDAETYSLDAPRSEETGNSGGHLEPLSTEQVARYKQLRALGHDQDEARRIVRGEAETAS